MILLVNDSETIHVFDLEKAERMKIFVDKENIVLAIVYHNHSQTVKLNIRKEQIETLAYYLATMKNKPVIDTLKAILERMECDNV